MSLRPGAELTLFVPDSLEWMVQSAAVLTTKPTSLSYVFRDIQHARDSQHARDDITLVLKPNLTIESVQQEIAKTIGSGVSAFQIAIFDGDVRLNSLGVIGDARPEGGVLGFSVVDEAVGLYVRLREQSGFASGNLDELERNELHRKREEVARLVTEKEQRLIERESGDSEILDAVAIYLMSGKNLDAVRRNTAHQA
jgi:hypothetical protein